MDICHFIYFKPRGKNEDKKINDSYFFGTGYCYLSARLCISIDTKYHNEFLLYEKRYLIHKYLAVCRY